MAVTLEVVLNPKTMELQVEIKGQVGTECTTITGAIAKGHEVLDEKLTEDYYEVAERPDWVIED